MGISRRPVGNVSFHSISVHDDSWTLLIFSLGMFKGMFGNEMYLKFPVAQNICLTFLICSPSIYAEECGLDLHMAD